MSEAGRLEDRRWLALGQRWRGDGAPLGEAPAVRWLWAGGRLVWEVRAPRPMAARDWFAGPGWVEGLWKQEVAECFLAEPGGEGYGEFHLAPGGAWWSGDFGAPRVAREVLRAREAVVACEVRWTERHWIGRQILELEAPEGVRANFAAITVGPEGRRFFSLAPLGGERPDFHQPEEWPLLAELG